MMTLHKTVLTPALLATAIMGGIALTSPALAAKDGERDNRENIEYVVEQIRQEGKDFLLDVIGSKQEGLKQIFSNASEHSSLIIEYVQRFGEFAGFFTRENVAQLTHAAGVADELLVLQAEANARE